MRFPFSRAKNTRPSLRSSSDGLLVGMRDDAGDTVASVQLPWNRFYRVDGADVLMDGATILSCADTASARLIVSRMARGPGRRRVVPAGLAAAAFLMAGAGMGLGAAFVGISVGQGLGGAGATRASAPRAPTDEIVAEAMRRLASRPSGPQKPAVPRVVPDSTPPVTAPDQTPAVGGPSAGQAVRPQVPPQPAPALNGSSSSLRNSLSRDGIDPGIAALWPR